MEKLKNERGAVAIMFAIVSVALLMMLALVVDVGQAYVKRSQLQTVVDAAALAAAQDLSQGKSEDTALQSAQTYANDNTDDSFDNLNITFGDDDDDADSVKIEAKQSDPTFIARVMGINIISVGAEAEAKGQLANAVIGVAPMLAPEAEVATHIGPENTAQFPIEGGGFWLADFSNSNAGASTFEEWVLNGYPDPVTIGDAGSSTGVIAKLKAPLQIRLENNPKMIIPLFQTPPAGSGAPINVIGFAEFVLTDFMLTGGNKYFEGYFTDGAVVNGVSVPGGGEPDFGIVVLKLTD